ncbi:MAG: DNA polymerase III subunit alpha, partial [Candidatus Melainabacteria bacterium]|nr:DNA polymerase III subunit alpha [Candidatus Melainabacteria bacterium]
MKYSELHCHSSFSLLDGASNPEELVLRAKQIGLSALALTDHNDLGGIVRFAQAAKEVSLDAIIGAEVTLDDDSHLTLLVENAEGYKNLCHLITQARCSCPRGQPRVSYTNLISHASGLVALSGCPHGRIPSSLARGQVDEAHRFCRQLLECFNNNFFLELWNHHLAQETIIARQMLELCRSYSIPWVVTNNVHYATPNKRIIHDVLTCLRHEVTLQTAGRRLRPNAHWYMKSSKEIAYLWRHTPEGVTNTQLVAERCQFRLGLLKPSLPSFPLPTTTTHNNPTTNHNDLLAQLVWEGAAKRYPNLTEKHINQIKHELELIAHLNLVPYFLIMWDIVRFAKSQNIAVQGRGSAANSVVCYCLAITAVDPVEMDFLFERFLSEGRTEPPDIDLDIAHQEREKVLQYVYDKYGREHAAMVCEIITYRGPSAVRDAAKVLGFSQEQTNRLVAKSHFHEAIEAAQTLANGAAHQAGLDLQDKRVQLLIKVVAGLNQLPRHRSIHVGGFVLSGEPLGEMVPIEPASMKGRTIIQWDKDDLDFVGLIKIDLLGLGMLTVIQEVVKLVKKHRGIEIDLARLDMNDLTVYTMLAQADTIGVFQVESRAQMNILPKLRPQCFYDIVISIALVRPGPIQG